jgi:hypothetical protein
MVMWRMGCICGLIGRFPRIFAAFCGRVEQKPTGRCCRFTNKLRGVDQALVCEGNSWQPENLGRFETELPRAIPGEKTVHKMPFDERIKLKYLART